jgi:prepilin-type N-terminal cleavage/methylation domain-containing protein
MSTNSSGCYGFSLIELSIVIVILGLMTGGILTGKSLIHAAELRSVTVEFSEYQTAVAIFKEKYIALPGDMMNATQFWGRADNGTFSGQCSAPAEDIGTGTQTCNGDGNGKIGQWYPHVNYYETFRFWQHLSNADLIVGKFTGVHGSLGQSHAIIDENTPASNFSSAGWTVEQLDTNFPGDSLLSYADYGNYYEVGSSTYDNANEGPLFTPEETWNLDKKMDDGKPYTGKLLAGYWADCTDGSSVNDVQAEYDLITTDPVCMISFIKVF